MHAYIIGFLSSYARDVAAWRNLALLIGPLALDSFLGEKTMRRRMRRSYMFHLHIMLGIERSTRRDFENNPAVLLVSY